jgi:hypothetical protein
MEDIKPEKYQATWLYVSILFTLIILAIVGLYFVEVTTYRFILIAVPLILLFVTKNTVIELHSEYFIIKNYFLLIKVRKHRYLYNEIAFVHYHRHAHIFASAFDFWGFYKQKPIEVRYKNQIFEALPIYGVKSIILKGIQAVNDRIFEPAEWEHNNNM